jgi:D-serine deaminase-like pyridoxal phosphate-dependent protein
MDPLTLSPRAKSIPPRFWGRAADEVAAERPALAEFSTPLVTIDAAAERHNVETMFRWAAERGLELAPHGKTTMAPELWAHLVDAGATALTVATPWQAQVARSAGIRSILLANEVADPAGIAWIRSELDADPHFEFACWIDSPEGLAAIAAAPGERPVDVLVELGAVEGRAGIRGQDNALALAWAASREPSVRLVGVAGWEGGLADDRSPESLALLRGYLDGLVGLLRQLRDFELFNTDRPIITAGGSAFFDLVADAFAPLVASAPDDGGVRCILRSGAFQVHDDVHYRDLSPLGTELTPALSGWARVLSRPSPTLALLDGGKRDFAADLDLPVPLAGDGSPLPGARITKVNDQHAFLELPAESRLAVGDVVRLGLSHPCTTFDKWRVIPVIDGANRPDARVVGFVETFF